MEKIIYSEIDQNSGYDSIFVSDINHLLLQLDPSAPTVTRKSLLAVLESGTRLFVAINCQNMRAVGMASLVPTKILMGRKNWIEDVIVDVDYQRQGIASKLMDMVESASHAELGTNLCSSPRRRAAWKLYKLRGYVRRKTNVLRLENKGKSYDSS